MLEKIGSITMVYIVLGLLYNSKDLEKRGSGTVTKYHT